MIINENRTDSYMGTVDLSNADDMNMVTIARKLVKEANVKLRESGKRQMYVKLQGRGHRQGVRRYNQSLPLKYATSADVYIYNR